MVAFNSNSLLESPVVPVPRLLDPPTPSKGPRLLQLNYAMCLAKPLQRSTYMNGHVLSLVDVARIMSNLDLPLKTLPELETSSEIANASLKATQNKESTRPSERVKTHMMELQNTASPATFI